MHLNYLPLRFTSDLFKGGIIQIPDGPRDVNAKDNPLSLKLRELRHEHGSTHVFHGMGNAIACVGLRPEAPLIGEPKNFDILTDFQLANALARSALFRFFTTAGNETVTGYRPVTLLREKHNLASQRQDIFGIFPEYTLNVRPLAPHEGDITSGVLIGFGIRNVFLKSVADLHAEGIPVKGLYLVQIRDDEDATSPFERRYLGRLEDFRDGTAILSDADVGDFPANECYLEGSRTNIEVVGKHILGQEYDEFSQELLKQTFSIMGAENQVRRLNDLGAWLEKKSPIACAAGINIRIHQKPHPCPAGTDAGYSNTFRTPTCVLRPGGSITVPWPVDKQIDLHGPYDAESFPDKRVKIAVICPAEFTGEAGQFLRMLKEGINSSDENAPFRKGFVRKYQLTSADLTFHEVQRGTHSLEDAYKAASLAALNEKPNLAVVVIREQHRSLSDTSNPYFATKARIMAQGVPVQSLKIETIRRPNPAYILNNMSLAMYAKLGGIPWTLTPNTDNVHEIIVGIGSARLNDSRRGAGERVIGITTVFSGDGQYLLANNTEEVSSEHYLEALTGSLQATVKELRSRFGWKKRDRVRFVFHQKFKKYKDVEAQAVRAFADSLTEYDVQYAFVHVSDSHDWMLFEPTPPRTKYPSTSTKGKMVPPRGQCVPLGPYTALLTLTGPSQLKTPLQGCPHPILINIHEESTFKSLDYLARQVFNLSFMSWRGFTPSTLPVSISYSDRIVEQLAHLRHFKNWNPETLSTALKERRWFL